MIIIDDIIIRAVRSDDIDTIYKWNSQAERGDFQEFTFSSMDNLTKQLQNGELFTETFQLLVVESPLGSPAGLVYLNFVRNGMARIGLVINSKARSLGIGKIVTKEICRYIFDNYPIARIEADTDIGNIAAQKVLELSGFEKEGILRKYRFHHGQYRDSVLFSMISDGHKG